MRASSAIPPKEFGPAHTTAARDRGQCDQDAGLRAWSVQLRLENALPQLLRTGAHALVRVHQGMGQEVHRIALALPRPLLQRRDARPWIRISQLARFRFRLEARLLIDG